MKFSFQTVHIIFLCTCWCQQHKDHTIEALTVEEKKAIKIVEVPKLIVAVVLVLTSHQATKKNCRFRPESVSCIAHKKQYKWRGEWIFLIKNLENLFTSDVWNVEKTNTWSPIVDHRIPCKAKLGGHDPSENPCSSTLSYRRILVHYTSNKYLSSTKCSNCFETINSVKEENKSYLLEILVSGALNVSRDTKERKV